MEEVERDDEGAAAAATTPSTGSERADERPADRLPQRSTSPRMKDSSRARPAVSSICSGGDFMKYVAADRIGPPMPRSLAIFTARSASMMMPAEFGESHTSSLYSRFSGTSPKARPSRRTYAHLRSSSHSM